MYYRRSTSTATKRPAAKRKAVDVRMFSGVDVFAAACAAQRINGEYLKEPAYVMDDDYKVISTREANKVVMRKALIDQPELVTDEDRALAQEIQQYFQCKLMDVLTERANEFTRTAMELGGREQFAANDWLALATVACLPQSYVRGLERDKRNEVKQEAVYTSQHVGKVGDKINGTLTVLESRYSRQWETWYVTATVGTDVMLFAYRDSLDSGTVLKFAGTIKAHRDDSITQLSRVRIK
jgi:hypothetical protein